MLSHSCPYGIGRKPSAKNRSWPDRELTKNSTNAVLFLTLCASFTLATHLGLLDPAGRDRQTIFQDLFDLMYESMLDVYSTLVGKSLIPSSASPSFLGESILHSIA